MDIVITEWALNSYLELKHSKVFSPEEYWEVIRPDTLLLANYPVEPKFGIQKFWSPAEDRLGVIRGGFKMKWHQVGSGAVQLRLPVGIDGNAFLCEAYVKDSKSEPRRLHKFRFHLERIREGNFSARGRLT